jgi:hypothetical protein
VDPNRLDAVSPSPSAPHPHPVFQSSPLRSLSLEVVTLENGFRYYLHPELGRLPSVTTVLKLLPVTDSLVDWYSDLRERGIDPDERLKYTSVRGSIVHSHCSKRLSEISEQAAPSVIGTEEENVLMSEMRDSDLGDITFEIEQADLMFEMFLEDHETFPVPGGIEFCVLHPEERFAGTADLLAVIDDHLTLVDVKTSSRILPRHELQAWAYRYALEATHKVPVEQLAILTLCPDLEFVGKRMNPKGEYVYEILERDRFKEFLSLRRRFKRELGL